MPATHAQRPCAPPEVQGTILVLISATGFGTLAILAKLAYRAGIPTLLALNWRFILATALLLGFVAVNRLPWRVRLSEAVTLLLLGGVGYAAQASLFFSAVRYIPASATSLLLYTYPAFVSLLSYALWRTPLGRRHLAALASAGLGTFLLLWSPGLHLNPIGTACGLGASVVYSVYLLANQRLSRHVDPGVASCYIIGGAAITFTFLNVLSGKVTAAIAPAGWLALALMAFFATAVAIGTLLAGIRRLGAAKASVLSTFEPLVTVLLAAVLLGERLSVGQLLGGVLISSGVLLLNLPARLRQPVPESTAGG